MENRKQEGADCEDADKMLNGEILRFAQDDDQEKEEEERLSEFKRTKR